MELKTPKTNCNDSTIMNLQSSVNSALAEVKRLQSIEQEDAKTRVLLEEKNLTEVQRLQNIGQEEMSSRAYLEAET